MINGLLGLFEHFSPKKILHLDILGHDRTMLNVSHGQISWFIGWYSNVHRD